MTDKQIIIDGVDVGGCECYSVYREGYCGWHTPCEEDICPYKLKWALQQLTAKEQECERLKEDEKSLLNVIDDLQKTKNEWREKYGDLGQDFDQLKAELKSAKELREYTYDCCKQAGEELAKNSFEWDGKEKNLVVQAMELNERYDQLKAENERLKNAVMLKCPQCGEIYLNPVGAMLYETLTEIKEIAEMCRASLYGYDQEKYPKQILQKISEVEDD